MENKWVKDNNPPYGKIVYVKIRHCNKKLKLKDETTSGQISDDGFYLEDGGELSYNWDILEWKLK